MTPRLRVPLLHCAAADIQYFFGVFEVARKNSLRMVNWARRMLLFYRIVLSSGRDFKDAPDRSAYRLHPVLRRSTG